MTLNLITLATIKAQLGLTATTYDVALTALIPIVSADVRRILKRFYDIGYACTYSAGSKDFFTPNSVSRTVNYMYSQASGSPVRLGDVLSAPGITADTYIESYDPTTGIYQMSAAATGTGSYVYPTVNVAMWPTIAKMVWYKYSAQNTESASVKNVASESFGPVSVSYSAGEINKKYNYPQSLIDDLGTPYASVE